MIFGVDISDFQAGFDLRRAATEGFSFAFFKATEGSTWRSQTFAGNLAAGRAAGLLVAAYHYIHAADMAGQVRNIQAVVPLDCPLILDAETGSGDLGVVRDLTARLSAAGYRLPVLYLPQWYASQVGATNLAGLPPLWSSHYPNSRSGPASAVFGRNASWLNGFWGGYGGQPTAIIQFTDQGVVAGRPNIDCSAYQGTRDQLAALLGGAPTTPRTSEDSVSHIKLDPTPAPTDPKSDPATWETREVTIPIAQIGGWHGDAMLQVALNPYYAHDPQTCGFVRYANWFTTPNLLTTQPTPVGVDDVINQAGEPWKIMWPAKWGPAPANTVSFSLMYAAPSGGCIEVERQF